MPFLSYVLCHIMTLKRMLAESAVEKYKDCCFCYGMGETLCKISFFGHNILLRKNMVSKLKAFEMICKYYLFFRNFDIDFFAPMVYNKTKGVRRCHSVTFKTTE